MKNISRKIKAFSEQFLISPEKTRFHPNILMSTFFQNWPWLLALPPIENSNRLGKKAVSPDISQLHFLEWLSKKFSHSHFRAWQNTWKFGQKIRAKSRIWSAHFCHGKNYARGKFSYLQKQVAKTSFMLIFQKIFPFLSSEIMKQQLFPPPDLEEIYPQEVFLSPQI